MYTTSLQKNLIAQHYLLNEEGVESQIHSHPYRIEISLSGKRLDENGYLINLIDVDDILTELIEHFSDKTLNTLPEFKEVNPSLENFASVFCEAFLYKLKSTNITTVRVRIWESDDAWASYQREVS